MVARPASVRAILYDLDGVLVRSGPAWLRVMQRAADRFGHPRPTPERFQAAFGQGMEADRRLFFPDRSTDEISAFYDAAFPEEVDRVEVVDGAVDLLRAARDRGLEQAVVTNCPAGTARLILERRDLAPFLQTWVTASDGAEKPAPDLIHLALDRLGLSPGEVLYVGDSHTDLEAARAAGVFMVGFGIGADAEVGSLLEVLDLLSPADELAGLREAFQRYAALDHADLSPLNRRLAEVVGSDDALLRVARASPAPHAAPSHMAVAVHDLLLSGVAHGAARFFPSITQEPDGGDPGAALADLVRTEATALATRMRERPLQTNEVGRAACLLPALAVAFERGGHKPLALVEIGASAGLLLRLDRYRVEYLPAGPGWGPQASRVRLRCELWSGALTLPEALPIATRVGVDLHPVDHTDPRARRWLRAQVMPEHAERAERLTAALSEARTDPPRVLKGDAVDLLPDLLAAVPGDVTPCILSSHVLYQLDDRARSRLDGIVEEASALQARPFAWVRMEQEAAGCVLALRWTDPDGTAETTLGRCDPFGRWLEWTG